MTVHTHPSLPCPICGFGLKDESKVLSFLHFVNENEEQTNRSVDPEDLDVKTLQGAGLLPKRLSDEPLDDRIQEMFGAFGVNETIQAKIQEIKNMLKEFVSKYVDDDEMDQGEWIQTMIWLYEKGKDDPDEVDLLEWYLLEN